MCAAGRFVAGLSCGFNDLGMWAGGFLCGGCATGSSVNGCREGGVVGECVGTDSGVVAATGIGIPVL